jgi:hypothetical protein
LGERVGECEEGREIEREGEIEGAERDRGGEEEEGRSELREEGMG